MKYILALICIILLAPSAAAACQYNCATLDNAKVETLYAQDADIQETTILPVTITNNNNVGQEYTLKVENLQDVGTYRVQPRNTFLLFPGQSIHADILIDLKETAGLGTREIRLVLESDGKEKYTKVTLHIKEAYSNADTEKLKKALEVTLILVLFTLLVVGFIFAYRKVNDDTEVTVSPLYDNHKEVLASEGIQNATAKRKRSKK